MKKIIDIRAHHLFDFSRALVDEEFREKEYLKTINKKGFCYSEKESEDLRKLLGSVNNNALVKIVLGKDNICSCCTLEDDYNPQKDKGHVYMDCEFPDSVWEAKKLLGKIIPNEVMSIRHLKNQYRLYERLHSRKKGTFERIYDRYGTRTSWKKVISEAHKLYRRRRVA